MVRPFDVHPKRRAALPWVGLLAASLVACGEGGRPVLAHYGSGALRSEGRETRVAEGVWERNGPFRLWYENGDPEAEGEYRDDVPCGLWTTWYPGGAVQSRGSYLFGDKEGVWLHRRRDGSLDEELSGVYEAGERIADARLEGEYTDWYAEDRPRERAVWVDGLRHGPAATWYPDGAPRSEGRYAAGRRTGRWVFWHPDGTVDTELSGVYEGWDRIADGRSAPR